MNTNALRQKILDLAIHGKLVDSGKFTVDSLQTEPSSTKNGYVHHLRIKLLEKLKPHLGKIKNIKTGIVANLSKKSVDKMTSAKALEKSKNNGFTINEHFEIAEQIKTLYENADLAYEHGNLKNPNDVNVVSIKRFVIGTSLKSGTAVDVLITVKESLANGNKIYSIELDEINKASERFRGLSDAAEKSADRATKTPHVDNSNITQKAEKSSDNRPRHCEETTCNSKEVISSEQGKMPHGLDFANAKSETQKAGKSLDFPNPCGNIPEDEEPFELPQGWKWARLGEICETIPTKKYQILEKEIKKTGKFPVISQSGNFIEGYTDNQNVVFKINGNPIIIFGDHTRNVKYIDFDFVVGADGVKILKPNASVISKFFYYLVLDSSSKIEDRGYGRHFQFINKRLYSLPPLAEQKVIVAKIEQIFAQIDFLEQNKSDLQDAVKQAKRKILDLAIHGKLVDSGQWLAGSGQKSDSAVIEPTNAVIEPTSAVIEPVEMTTTQPRHREDRSDEAILSAKGKMPHGFASRGSDESNNFLTERGEATLDFANAKSETQKAGKSLDFPNPCGNISKDGEPCLTAGRPFELPQGWKWVSGNEIFLPMTSKKPSGKTFRYIDIDSIDNKNHKVKNPKELEVSKAPSRASRELKTGDILFSLVRPYLENIAFVDVNNSDCIASTGFYICRPSGGLYPKYAFYLMTSGYVVKGLNQFMKGDNSPSISGNDIQKWLYPLPPLAEQKRIVAKIESLFSALDKIQAATE